MALNTSPSFASGKSATGSNLAARVSGQRAAKRRAMPNSSGMMMMGRSSMGNPMLSNGHGGIGGGIPSSAVAARRGGPGMFGPSMKPSFGGGMPSSPPPMRVQAPPLMADAMPESSPMMGGGMVANTAPEFNGADFSARFKEMMGGNTGITGGLRNRGNLQMMY